MRGARAMAALLDRPPGLDGVFVANDLMAMGALEALTAAGRAVPGDVAVVGFDDVHAARSTTPPLTTVRQPLDVMTREMTALLMRRIAGDAADDERVVCPITPVRRSSA
jgi:DNA-binding LacI/PurR family transcriptional regulator